MDTQEKEAIRAEGGDGAVELVQTLMLHNAEQLTGTQAAIIDSLERENAQLRERAEDAEATLARIRSRFDAMLEVPQWS